MTTYEERLALANFLRTRRERISPTEVGITANQRRRTPGLRREELAQLANISVTWYTWLEQARDINVSEQVLQSLASALRLTPQETAYLFALAKLHTTPTPATIDDPLHPALQEIVDHQGIYPAYIMGRYWDILAWNRAALLLFDFAHMPNMLRYMFEWPEARQRIVDWEDRAKRIVAEFRADCSRYITDSHFIEFVDSLKSASKEFAAWWPLHNITGRAGGRREFDHPQVRRLVLHQTTFYLSNAPEVKLVLHTPLDEFDTATKLARLSEESDES